VPHTLTLGYRSPVPLPKFQMTFIFSFVTSSESKMKEPRYACLSQANASHSHSMWTEVSSSVPQLNSQHPQGPKRKKETRYVSKKKGGSMYPISEPHHVPPTGSLWTEMLRLQSQWFIHSFIMVGVPKISPPTKCGENIRSPFAEPHADGRTTYIFVRPGSPR